MTIRALLPSALVIALLTIGTAPAPSAVEAQLDDNAFPDWSSRGRIAFDRQGEGLVSMNADGTGARAIPGTSLDGTPSWSPDGARLVVQTQREGDVSLAVLNADGSHRRVVVGRTHRPYWPDWSPNGERIVFVGNGTIFLVNVGGTGLAALPVELGPLDYPSWPDWSPDGRRLVFATGLVLGGPLTIVDVATGALRRLTSAPDDHPAWSPDGRRIAFSRDLGSDHGQIFVINADGTGLRRLTRSELDDGYPTWSPDGRRIAFQRSGEPDRQIWIMNADGSGQRRLTGGPPPHAANGKACTVHGTPGPDVLAGTPGADVLCGFGGDDRILGGGGDDVVDGGPDVDRLVGGAGDDLLLARDGMPDTLDGGAGRDRARVDKGFDRLVSVERVE